jgi:peptidoglycan pentaglycine glycine transferase (the first glycine)
LASNTLVRIAAEADRPAWDDFVLRRCPGVLLQCWGWGELRRRYGWEVVRLLAVDRVSGGVWGTLPVQLRTGRAGVGFAYGVRGPLVEDLGRDRDRDVALALIAEAERLARRRHALVLKLDPEWPDGDAPVAAVLHDARLRPSWYDVQHRKTYLVDLAGGAEAVFGRLKESTRRNIRKAERGRVTVQVRDDAGALDEFHRLLVDTAQRNDFQARQVGYFGNLLECVGTSAPVAVVLAEHGGRALAGLVAVAAGSRLVYLYGGTSLDDARLQAPYAAHWRAIEWGIALGCTTYDMWGVPNHEDASVPGYGYYEFKTRWNGRVVRHIRCQDAPLWPRLGPLPRLAERVALRGRPLLT